MVRAADEPDSAYGLIAESADVAADRMSVTFKLRPAAQFSDGSPGDRRRRRLLLQHAEGEGPSELSHRHARRHQGRGARQAHRALHIPRHPGPRSATVGRRPLRAAQGLLCDTALRGNHAEGPRRFRPLHDRRPQAGRLHHLQAARRLLGEGPARQSRPLQLRRDPLRVFPRPNRRARSLEIRRSSICARSSPPRTGRRPTTFRRSRTAA